MGELLNQISNYNNVKDIGNLSSLINATSNSKKFSFCRCDINTMMNIRYAKLRLYFILFYFIFIFIFSVVSS